MTLPLLLASASPRRRELLERVGVPVEVQPADIDESTRDDPEASRPHFLALRALRDRLAGEIGRPLPVLSMGMSHDFEVAIAGGATHVRIGTAILGSRG